MWYTGAMPGTVSVTLDSGASSGEVGPTACGGQNNITICQYPPGQAFYPWRSNGPDRAVWIRIIGGSGPGTIRLRTTSAGTGTVDFYTGDYPYITEFTEKLAPGRLNDYSTTKSAVVIGAEVLSHTWVDINGVARSQTNTGTAGMLWSESAGGPTRDGRAPGVDVTTPGHGIFAAYARNSYWASFPHLLVQDGGGWYGRAGATSAAGPLGVGAVALMLQMDPTLTARKVKDILHATARQDAFTGAVPNNEWGYGKMDLLAALDMVAAGVPYTMADARQALRVAAGLEAAPAEFARLDVVTVGASAGRIDMADAVDGLRRVVNP